MIEKPMSADQILDKAREDLGEYLEMTANPDAHIVKYLAAKLENIQSYVYYMEIIMDEFRSNARRRKNQEEYNKTLSEKL